MPFNIADFSSQISTKGVAKASAFDVVVSRDFSPDTSIERDLKLRCIATDLPGATITTIEHSYAGPIHKIATGSSYLDQNLSILLSEDLSEKKYFEEWKRKVTGDYSNGTVGKDMFRLAYYKDYIGSITISTYKETGEKSYTVKLHEAYPIMINSMSMAWTSGAEFLTLPVTFAFRYYTEEK